MAASEAAGLEDVGVSVVAVILAGGQGERLSVLSEKRAKPAVPFAGKYRIIDFALSNCVNSGIYHVAVLTQYRPHSLHDHIGIGKPGTSTARGRRPAAAAVPRAPRVRLVPGHRRRRLPEPAFILADWQIDLVLILSGDHIYKHGLPQDDRVPPRARSADVTVGVMEVPLEEAHRFGTHGHRRRRARRRVRREAAAAAQQR